MNCCSCITRISFVALQLSVLSPRYPKEGPFHTFLACIVVKSSAIPRSGVDYISKLLRFWLGIASLGRLSNLPLNFSFQNVLPRSHNNFFPRFDNFFLANSWDVFLIFAAAVGFLRRNIPTQSIYCHSFTKYFIFSGTWLLSFPPWTSWRELLPRGPFVFIIDLPSWFSSPQTFDSSLSLSFFAGASPLWTFRGLLEADYYPFHPSERFLVNYFTSSFSWNFSWLLTARTW